MNAQQVFRAGCLVLSVAALAPTTGFGHARFRLAGTTPPRNTSTGLKAGPCGNVARTNNPTILQAGQTLTIQWEETVNHPGYYRIAFSPANDAGFDQNVWIANVPDVGDRNQYNQTITVPNTPCTGCTLQMIQYMTENPAQPSLYYSCADIEIRAAGAPMPSPTPRPSVVPGVDPPADCH